MDPLPIPPHKGEGETKKVLIEGPLFRVDTVTQLLAGIDVVIDSPPRPWSGDDVIGLLVWKGSRHRIWSSCQTSVPS